jgi:MFS family permease
MGHSLVPVTTVFGIVQAGGSASAIGLVLAAGSVTQVVTMPIGGVWADRLPRRLVMVVTDAIQMLAFGALALLILTNRDTVTAYALAQAVSSLGWAFFVPAGNAVVPDLVDADNLQPATALLGLSNSASSVLGPALAGVLVVATGPGLGMTIAATGFAVSMLFLIRLRRGGHAPTRATAAQQSFLADLREGWAELSRRRWYLSCILVDATSNIAWAFLLVLGPVFLAREGAGAIGWGVVAAGQAVGAVLGGVVALRLRPQRPFVAAHIAMTLTFVPLLALAMSAPIILVVVTAGAAALLLTLANEMITATQQLMFKRHVLARVTSLDMTISLGVMPVGFALAGPIADAIGYPAAFSVAAALLAVPHLTICFVPGVRSFRRLPGGLVSGDIEHITRH